MAAFGPPYFMGEIVSGAGFDFEAFEKIFQRVFRQIEQLAGIVIAAVAARAAFVPDMRLAGVYHAQQLVVGRANGAVNTVDGIVSGADGGVADIDFFGNRLDMEVRIPDEKQSWGSAL
jgi:hypothetical protein